MEEALFQQTMPGTQRTCRRCGLHLKKDMPHGICPRCILASLLEIEAAEESAEFPCSLGDYELIEKIGQGGMGIVYKARQVILDRIVAIKMLPHDHTSTEHGVHRFLAEASAAAALRHPNIVAIHQVGEAEGEYFFSMDFVEGRNLALVMQQEQISFRTAAELIFKISNAIHYAHTQGILHRDLKPANVLIDWDGEPRITDFGLAKKLDALGGDMTLTLPGQFLGSPGYMPPEQAGGTQEVSPASDVYSLGAILYELLSGHRPFQGETFLETIKLIQQADPLPPRLLNPRIPRELEAICLKCLEKDPSHRYPTAAALAQDLQRWLEGRPVTARRAGFPLRTVRWARRNSVAALFILFLIFGLSVSLALYRAARAERDARLGLLQFFIKDNQRSIENMPAAHDAYEHLPAEKLYAFRSQNPFEKPNGYRFVLGLVVDTSPMQTVICVNNLLPRIESRLEQQLDTPVRIDLRLYQTIRPLAEHLVSGELDLCFADELVYYEARLRSSGVRMLARDRRPGVQTVIFARRDTGITNLATLRGATLALWGENSSTTLMVKSFLVGAGLQSSDLNCVYMNLDPALFSDLPFNEVHSSLGYFRGARPTVLQVLKYKNYPASVAAEQRLGDYRENHDWVRLATFYAPEFVWIGGAKLNKTAAESFFSAITNLTNPKELGALLFDVNTPGFAFVGPEQSQSKPLQYYLSQADLFGSTEEQALHPENDAIAQTIKSK